MTDCRSVGWPFAFSLSACIALVRLSYICCCFFFFSSRRRHTRFDCDWSSDVCSSDLGAETVRLPGQKMSEAILAFAHDRNVTKIVVGKPRRRLWTRILIGSIVDTLVQGSGDIDIYVISAEREPGVSPSLIRRRAIPTEWAPYVWALAV